MKTKKALIYGSGISGLIVAYQLVKKGFLVKVVDPYNKPILQTLQTEQGPVELAANSILYNASVKELLDDIKLDYFFYNSHGKKKFFFHGKKAQRWPLTLKETFFSIVFIFKILFLKKKLKPQKKQTLKNWALKHMSQPLYEKVFKLGLQGVYGPNVDKLSASLVLKSFLNPKKKKATKMSGSVSFKRGMSELTQTLKKFLEDKGVSFVGSIGEDCNHESFVKVISTPAYSVPDFITSENKDILKKINYKKITTITLFFEEKFRVSFKGFGCVFSEPKGVLGLILNSDIFENRAKKGFVSETWILDGEVFKEKDPAIDFISIFRKNLIDDTNSNSKVTKEVAMESVTHEDTVHLKPRFSYFKYWEKAFPVYDTSLEAALQELKKQDNVYYFANWTGHLGIGRMMENSEKFVENLIIEKGIK